MVDLGAHVLDGSVIEPETDCWLWTRFIDTEGYGRTSGMTAHRASWLAFHGPVPDGFRLQHTCSGRRSCVNPSHLRVVPKPGQPRSGT